MAHVHIIYEIGLILSIVFLTFNFYVVSGVEFVEEPENVTLDSSWKQFTLNCSVDVATYDGIDWVAHLDGKKESEDIFVSLTNVSKAGYFVDRPNNRTANLIIRKANFQNSSVAGKYCCHGEDDQGPIACAYVTIPGVSQSPNTDITKANEATTIIATSTDLTTVHSGGLSSGGIAAIIISIILVLVVVVVVLLVCTFRRGCKIYNWRHRHDDLEARQRALNSGTVIGKPTQEQL